MENALKWLILLCLFAPLFYFSFKNKKWYLYLPCALVGILPDPFAIELSPSLPLLTVSRILILILFAVTAVSKWKQRKALFSGGFRAALKALAPVYCVLAYVLVCAVVSVIDFRFGVGNELRYLAILFLERGLFVLLIFDQITDRTELDRCMDAMLLGFAAVCIIGIVQSIFEYDIATVFTVTVPRVEGMLTPRMNMLRAAGTSNALIFGCHCAFMSLIAYFRLERTGKQRYSIVLALIVTAMLCTLSRSSWLCFLAIFGIIFLTRPLKLLERIYPALLLIAVLFTVFSIVNGNYALAMSETAKSSVNSVLSMVGIEGEASPDDPDGHKPFLDISEDFGLNEDTASASRMVEWTAVGYMLSDGHGAFGYGYRAFPRRMLHYFYPEVGKWTVAGTMDVGLLNETCERGLVGIIAYLALLIFLLADAFRRRGERGRFPFARLAVLMFILHLLLNFASAFSAVLWTVIGLCCADRKLAPDDGVCAPFGKWEL